MRDLREARAEWAAGCTKSNYAWLAQGPIKALWLSEGRGSSPPFLFLGAESAQQPTVQVLFQEH